MTHPLSIKIHYYYSEDMYNYIDTLHNCTTIISNNTIHMSSREGWEIYFPREEDENTYLDLLIADRDKINNIFQSNIPEMQNQNQRFTKTDLYLKFKDTIDTNAMKTWYKLDKTKYTRKGVLDVANFEYLYNYIINLYECVIYSMQKSYINIIFAFIKKASKRQIYFFSLVNFFII